MENLAEEWNNNKLKGKIETQIINKLCTTIASVLVHESSAFVHLLVYTLL
jgi:hypothetical protein